ncbi:MULTISPECIES: peptide deformylase [unclassified Fusibacter]|uniref:peptide deformylase n=1 Tax=unclassified Fusibacter TaxID=2624464 RepID=UPI001010751B|nr:MULTISPECIES: peptide deformylase [unclassified Fusibacter]MCK8058051.1 peptide deformylase [Fusibacter sp. A2]NPE20633.1 peptide deformylase [Fusibacter sp. A1]RXV62840.1 peptide deformylase [Fusibacter sp. A1]
MALRVIRTDEDPVLRKKSRVIEKFDDRLKTLVDDMLDTMYEADGVGLAAPQIGILKRVVVIDVYDGEGERILINPEIIDRRGEQFEVEGCLSLPGLSGRVKRPEWVKVRYQDLKGKWHESEGDDLLCRAFCHELDHLDGILFTDTAVMLSDEELELLSQYSDEE